MPSTGHLPRLPSLAGLALLATTFGWEGGFFFVESCHNHCSMPWICRLCRPLSAALNIRQFLCSGFRRRARWSSGFYIINHFLNHVIQTIYFTKHASSYRVTCSAIQSLCFVYTGLFATLLQRSDIAINHFSYPNVKSGGLFCKGISLLYERLKFLPLLCSCLCWQYLWEFELWHICV